MATTSKTRKRLPKATQKPRIENLLLDQTEGDLKRLDVLIDNHKRSIKDHTFKMGLLLHLREAVDSKVNGFTGAKLDVNLAGITACSPAEPSPA